MGWAVSPVSPFKAHTLAVLHIAFTSKSCRLLLTTPLYTMRRTNLWVDTVTRRAENNRKFTKTPCVSTFLRNIFHGECEMVLFDRRRYYLFAWREKESTQIKVKMANGCPLRSWRTAWLIFCGAALTSNLLLFYDFVQAFECWRSTESRFSCETQYIARCSLLFRRYPNPQR